MRVQSKLRDIRTGRGFSASELAARIGVSRQTIYAIEDGTFVPNTAIALKLSSVLDSTVEEIFSSANEPRRTPVTATLLARPSAVPAPFVNVCRVSGRMIAVPSAAKSAYLPSAEGVIEARKKLNASINCPAEIPGESKRLLVAGCDPALSLLNDALRGSGFDIVAVPCSSLRALDWLKKGKVHAAGTHLLDRASGEYNLPIVRRLLSKRSVRVVNFAAWEQGLVLARGNPKNIRSIADLARKDVRMLNREKGSGTRDLLDTGLRELGIRPEQVRGYRETAGGHLAAAYGVASGAADCCVATSSAARWFQLEFVPLAAQRFDLCFARASLDLPAAKALFETLNRASFRRKLACLAGYDTARTGDILM